ncbi:hypothetical protein OG474_07450 [Kribbella sp. NBC_01505]|uniref:hypothetical protein n=1 Tax=Kribbella sp. NBC_01505 TaxID=2903580 RepID=UPI0038696437
MPIPPSLMGELGVEAWDAEYRRIGRVVFRPRRRALLSRQMMLSWLVVVVPSVGTVADWDSRGVWFYVRAAIILLLLGTAVSSVVRILRGKPLLVVDTEGIRLGKGFTPWSAVATIGPPVKAFTSDHVPIRLTQGDSFTIPRDHVDDLAAFTTWLTHLHTERRT